MICEHELLIRNDEPDCPIIVKIPPPPLHTILLGPVNHIINNLMLYYPDVTKNLKSFI